MRTMNQHGAHGAPYIVCNYVIPAHAGIQGLWQEGGMEKQPCVYLLASKRNGTLCTGVTSNLLKRVWEHKNNLVESFTSKYGVKYLDSAPEQARGDRAPE